jgi:hypothetical protein
VLRLGADLRAVAVDWRAVDFFALPLPEREALVERLREDALLDLGLEPELRGRCPRLEGGLVAILSSPLERLRFAYPAPEQGNRVHAANRYGRIQATAGTTSGS